MTTIEELDAEIAKLPEPNTDEDYEARAKLVTRRSQLYVNAQRAVEAKISPKKIGNLAICVPKTVGMTHFYGKEGRVACTRVADNGDLVIDLFPDEFRGLLAERQFGLDWHNSNPDVLRQLAAA